MRGFYRTFFRVVNDFFPVDVNHIAGFFNPDGLNALTISDWSGHLELSSALTGYFIIKGNPLKIKNDGLFLAHKNG